MVDGEYKGPWWKKNKNRNNVLISIFTIIFVIILIFLKDFSFFEEKNWVNYLFFFFVYLFLLIFFFWITNILKGSGTKDSRYNANRELLQKVVPLLMSTLVLVILFGQLLLLSNQTKILERTSPPYEPYIKIVPDVEDYSLWSWDLVDNISYQLNIPIDYSWGKIDLTIYNFGKTDSQKIYCNPLEKNESLFAVLRYNKTANNIMNVPAGSSIRARLHIKHKDCHNAPEDPDYACMKRELVPIGKQKIILECDCLGCFEQRKFNETIDFCIYKDKESECGL